MFKRVVSAKLVSVRSTKLWRDNVFFTIFPHLQIINLICSLPLLEDPNLPAALVDVDDDLNFHAPLAVVQSSTSPPFTGTLELTLLLERNPLRVGYSACWAVFTPGSLLCGGVMRKISSG